MSSTTTHLPLYTADEYFILAESDQVGDDERVELLEGIIVGKSKQTPRHAGVITLMQMALTAAFADDLVVNQRPFIASEWSVPEPDLAVVRGTVHDYMDRHPSDALLVVEVAHTSLAQDRLTKSRIYAEAGVPEYWIANVRDGELEVYRSSDQEARVYRESEVLDRARSIKPLHAPAAEIPVADLVPAPPEKD